MLEGCYNLVIITLSQGCYNFVITTLLSPCHKVVTTFLYGQYLLHFNRLEEEEERQRAAAVTSSTTSTSDNGPGADQQFLKLMNVVSYE